ncbi:MAG: hypothetical protein H7Y07_14885 [Pyrinomonadaceae bacterium]|nr:hypothetical protein [Sphingobacteriaceae bacterium]
MRGIEALNQLVKRRQKLMEAKSLPWNEYYKSYVDTALYKGTVVKLEQGAYRIFEDNQEEYLKDCILSFILNILALKNEDPIKGYSDACKKVSLKNGYGKADDVILTSGDHFLRFRVCVRGEPSIQEKLYMHGNYIVVRSFQHFYDEYVKRFGEIDISKG